MKLKHYALLTTALTGVVFSGAAMAQTATTDTSASGSDVEEVVVVGIRKSLQKSLSQKRNNSAQVEVINAEDVTKFPDTNVAEALSRLPGITVDRSGGGEGQKVAILGIDSRLINVSLNGNPLATADSQRSAPDSGRSFNFANLAPELIGNVEVYKSTQARLDEGGIGGSIIVNSRKPLDLPANTLTVSLNYNKNLRNDSSDPRYSVFYSWRNDDKTFGGMLTIASNKMILGGSSVSVLSGYQSLCDFADRGDLGRGQLNFYPTAIPGGNRDQRQYVDGTRAVHGGCNQATNTFQNPSKLPTVTSGPALRPDMLIPRNLNSGSFEETRDRMTYQGALQWRPTEDLEFNLTGYYVSADNSYYSQAMLTNIGEAWDDTQAYDSTVIDPVNNLAKPRYPTTYTSVTTNEFGITGGKMSNVAVRLDANYNRSHLITRYTNLQGKWTPGAWTIEANAGYTQAQGGTNPQYFLSFYGNTSAEWSMDGDNSYLKTGTPLTDPSIFKTRQAGGQAGFVKVATSNDKISYAKLDFRREVEWGIFTDILFGIRNQEHSNSNNSHFFNVNVRTTGSLADYDFYTTDPSAAEGLGASGDLLSFASLTPGEIIAYSNANRNPGMSAGSPTGDFNNTGEEWSTVEQATAAYIQGNFRSGRFHGDVGVRFVKTENEQTYFSSQNYYPWIGDFQTSEQDYNDVLPAANLVYDLADDKLLRFTVAKVMSRPTFSQQSGQVTYNIQQRVGGGGNPNLEPYRATNWGASYEHYFAPNSLFSVDVFLRDIQSYIVDKQVLTTIELPDATVDYCNIPVPATNGGVPACPGVVKNQDILLTTPFNGSGAKVTGVSLNYQGEIKWGFGIQANVTWLDEEYESFSEPVTVVGTNGSGTTTFTAQNVARKYPMPYLSKWSYTVSPYYEKGPIQARLSYTYRSKYTERAGSETTQPAYTSEWGQLDAQASYNVNDNLQINVSAQNIIDPLNQPFSTGNLPLGWDKYGTRIIAGLTYKLN